jgi:excisionase family DNA binding protein
MNLLTTKEIMSIYKVTRTTVSDWRKEGMPFKKYGKLVRFNFEDVSLWLEKRG